MLTVLLTRLSDWKHSVPFNCVSEAHILFDAFTVSSGARYIFIFTKIACVNYVRLGIFLTLYFLEYHKVGYLVQYRMVYSRQIFCKCIHVDGDAITMLDSGKYSAEALTRIQKAVGKWMHDLIGVESKGVQKTQTHYTHPAKRNIFFVNIGSTGVSRNGVVQYQLDRQLTFCKRVSNVSPSITCLIICLNHGLGWF